MKQFALDIKRKYFNVKGFLFSGVLCVVVPGCVILQCDTYKSLIKSL